eukprot:jgi/Chrzof1/352/Cz01g12180.t1
MGFLKELFEKKLKTSDSKGGASDLEVQRVQSEYTLPQLRTQSPGRDPTSLGSGDGSRGDETADSVCYLRTQNTARSFSYAQVKKKQVEQAEHIAAQMHQTRLAPQKTIKYDSVSQFSHKVDLYRGSVSTVYKAVCNTTSNKVIIKAYHKHKMHPKHFHKLHREIQAMRALNGPYVAEFYSTFEDAQCIYIIMEYCEGGDLFKTMLMHGSLLDEQWVCVEIITPLLRILEKMHSLKLLHRDIKPENIFLTSLGKFKLGDFGLAIKYDEEIPFSRSGTLDYMAPEVLKNPSVPFQESKSVDLAALTQRGVKPYGPPVDVWAAGVLAYELVCGRPPFEVEDEAQTAALIMYSDAIKFPPNRTPQWADFVRASLLKSPDHRPTAAQLLGHPWIQLNLQRTMLERYRPSKEMLLQPLPLDMAGTYTKEFKRTMSLGSGAGHGNVGPTAPAMPASPMSPLPTGAVPTAVGRECVASMGPTATGSSSSNGGAVSPNERLREIQATVMAENGFKRLSTRSETGSSDGPHSPKTPTGSSSHAAHTSPLSGLKPLKVALPPETEFEVMGSSDSFMYSPTTPAPKPGIKERMKFYFQRQAGF